MKPDKIQKNLIDLLRNNLIDPNSYRRSKQKNWIYSDFPKLTATMPRIAVQMSDSPMTTLGASTNAQYQDIRIDISILINRQHKYTVNGEENTSPESTASYLSHQIMKNILTKEKFKEKGLLQLRPINETKREPPKDNIMLRQVELLGKNIRRFNEI